MNENNQGSKRRLIRRGLLILLLLISPYLLLVGIEEIAYRIMIHNQTTATYFKSNSPIAGRINAVETDERGNVWVGTENGLHSISPDGTWITYTTENSGLLNNNIHSLAVYGWNNIWVGTSSGLCVLDSNGNWKTYFLLEDEDYRPSIPAILVDHFGRVWVGTSRGLYMYEANKTEPTSLFRFGVPFETITALAVDKHNRVWVGTRYGLRVIDPSGNWKLYQQNPLQRKEGLISDDITALLVDHQDRVWVGTAWGVSILNPDDTWTWFYDEYPNLEKYSYSYSVDPTNAFALDQQGRVWIAHWTIVTAIEPSGQAIVYQLWYSDLKYVDDLEVDQEGRLWLGTAHNGLKVVDLEKGIPKPIPANWLTARTKLLTPIQRTAAFMEPIGMWLFLPAFFGGGIGIIFIVFLVGIVVGVIGLRKGRRDSNRNMLNIFRGILTLSLVGAVLLWAIASLVAFLFLRD